MGKNPAFQFYPNDWLGDPELQQATASTRGIWINLLCHMWWSRARGILSGTISELSRLAGCTETEWIVFHEENSRLKFADVTLCNKIVTVTNRRMVREEQSRISTRLRVKRFRNASCNAEVTVPSPNTPSPGTKVPSKKPVLADAPTNGNHPIKALLNFYDETYQRLHNGQHPVIGGEDAKAAQAILRNRTDEVARRMVTSYLENPPQFYKDKGLYGMRHILSAANTLLARREVSG